MKTQHPTGAIFSPRDVRDWRGVACAAAGAFPERFELAMPPVKDQGSVCSCVACAVSTAVEYFSRTQGDDTREMSIGYIYGNRSNTAHTGTGMVTRDAIAVTCDCGDCVNTLFPYNEEVPDIIEQFEKSFSSLLPKAYPNRFTSYHRVSSESDIKASLMQNGPVLFAMQWHDGNFTDKLGILHEAGEESGGHCMVLYGWCPDGWLIQNSWGTGWGLEGRAILPYSTEIREAWGIVDTYSEAQRKRQIEELEAQNAALAETNAALTEELEAMSDRIDVLSALEGLTEEQAAEITRLSDALLEKTEEIKENQKRIEEGQERIALLEAELLEIKRPYDTALGRFFAKIANAVINAVYAVVRWFEKIFKKG